jgi:hypothetical protein
VTGRLRFVPADLAANGLDTALAAALAVVAGAHARRV